MNKRFLSTILFGALLASSTGTFTSCKDYDDDIKGLQEQIDANKKTLDDKAAALQSALDAAKQEIAAAKAAAAAAQTTADKAAQAAAAAKEAAAQAKADAIAEAQRLVNELKTTVDKKVDKSVYDAKMATIDATINVINGKLDELKTADEKLNAADIALQEQINALKKFQTSIEALNLTTEFPELKGKVATLISDLNALKDRVSTNETDIATLKTDLSALSDRVEAVESGLSTLRDLLSHRLTSLTFAPTSFINGIEVINFATLQYKPWSKLLADKTDGATQTSINDGKTQAIYFASPSSVKQADIKKLTILSQDATNTMTRAVEQPIIIASIAKEIEGGKMTVNLKKNIEGSFNKAGEKDKEHFTLVALQADIQLTEDEIAKGMQPSVISDWARLAETSVTPYIHYTKYTSETENIATDQIPHFYNYTTIHDAGTEDGICNTEHKYVIKNLEYTEALDLNTLVAVCDKDGNRYDAAAYGLEFSFNLVNYYLKDQDAEKTNQKSFAKIDKGVISSCSRNGIANNKDAIGREPMVQVVLKNTANKEVVDVRYFKISWTAERVNTELGNLDTFTDIFACGEEYVNTVGTAIMNDKVYTVAMAGGISKEEFHTLYALDTQVYASLDDAKAGTPVATKLGTVEDVPASGSTTTHNLKWTFNINDNTITKAEYDAGVATRTVYSRYYRRSDDAETFTFSMTLTLNINKMAFVAGYEQTYWNEGAELSNTNINKMFQVNPALTDDANYGIAKFFDCRILADMLTGYNKTSAVITAPIDLVSNAASAKLVFDKQRVSALLGAAWNVSTDGLTLKKGAATAAIIDGGVIRLYENPIPTTSLHGVATDAAQELLGKNVPVKLVATNCADITVELDHFLVNFINPLEMTLADVTDSFKDLLTNGSSISVDKIATIKEAFGLYRAVWANGAEVTPLDKLVQWYNVGGVTWDLTKATTNLKKDGQNIIITSDVKASNWSVFKDKYILNATPSEVAAKTLTFKNNSNAHIQQAFKIAVPVYVNTKWAPKLADPTKMIVVLTVNP